ncbi:hypothetical protein DCO48_17350 [Pseudomonas sp. SDI]|uniref:MBL fold metallo-hydrolase n=1 Tax=Pseudomonas sp. SDI TaxID=2170734 RepID=UPI000DE705A5|nr:MBL fold metallo-hydrolase [Pseudomonas sp. SDI]PWB31425.1 hypothetical protein DCO48_17350 [Pseudomonas sp. SDI]
MNPYFSVDEDAVLPPLPKVGYARIDDIEYSTSNRMVRVTFDMVDAEWMDNRLAARGGNPLTSEDFVQMPLFHLEMAMKTRRFQRLKRFRFHNISTWYTLHLNPHGQRAILYANQSARSTPVAVKVRRCERSPELTKTFDLGTPTSELNPTITALLGKIDSERVIVFDVGQGSANGLIRDGQSSSLYFDTGAGVYGNQHTRPTNIDLPADNVDVVILSHWDGDHWAGATLEHNRELLKKIWIAPKQVVGPSHKAFADSIKQGNLILLEMGETVAQVTLASGRQLRLAQGTNRSTRNDGGLVLCIDNPQRTASMLLPGDCDYSYFKHLDVNPLKGLVVPHHGARLESQAADIPTRHLDGATLAYSFGPSNRHGPTHVRHPTAASVEQHSAWNHAGWNPASPGVGLPTGEVRATCEHPPGTHRGDVYLDW